MRKSAQLALLFVIAVFLRTAGSARAQLGCEDQIERCMRGIQLRHTAVRQWYDTFLRSGASSGGFVPQINRIEWPPDLDGNLPGDYPPDGFYAGSIRRDPHFGVWLIYIAQSTFFTSEIVWVDSNGGQHFGSAAASLYVREPFNLEGVDRFNGVGPDGTPVYVNTEDHVPKYKIGDATVLGDFVADWHSPPISLNAVVVTPQNACKVLASTQASVDRLQRLYTIPTHRCTSYNRFEIEPPYNREPPCQAGGRRISGMFPALVDAVDTSRGMVLCCWGTTCSPPECGWRHCGQCPACNTIGCAGPSAREQIIIDWYAGASPTYQVTRDPSREAGRYDIPQVSGLPKGVISLYPSVLAERDTTDPFVFGAPLPADNKFHLAHAQLSGRKLLSPVYGYSADPPVSFEPLVVTVPDPNQSFRHIVYYGWRFELAYMIWKPDFQAMERAALDARGSCQSCGGGSAPGGPQATISSSGVTLDFSLGRSVNGIDAGHVVVPLSGGGHFDMRQIAYGIRASSSTSIVDDFNDETIRVFDTGRGRLVIEPLPPDNSTNPPTPRIGFVAKVSTTNPAAPIQTTTVVGSSIAVADPSNPSVLANKFTYEITVTGQCPTVMEARQITGQSATVWELATGPNGTAFLRTERITVVEPTPQGDQVTRTEVIGSDGVESVREETTRQFAWGRETVLTTEGLAGNGMGIRSESTEFGQNEFLPSGQPDPSYRRVIKRQNTESGWSTFEYDENGSIKRQIRQLRSNPWVSDPDLRAVQNRSIEHRTLFADLSDTAADAEIISERIERQEGKAIARSYSIGFGDGSGVLSGPLERESWSVRMSNPNPPANLAGVVAELNLVLAQPWSANYSTSIEIMDLSGPEPRTARRILSETELVTFQRTGAPALRTTTVKSGRPTSPMFQDVSEGNKSVTVVDSHGVVISSMHYAIDGSTEILLESTTVPSGTGIDDNGRLLRRDFSDGTSQVWEYGCCGLVKETDRQGLEINFVYDSLRRPIQVAKQTGAIPSGGGSAPVLTNLTQYDAEGRAIVESRAMTGQAGVEALGGSKYDLAGRLIESFDAFGSLTTYSESTEGLRVVDTQTLPDPDGPTGPLLAPRSVSRRWQDGSPSDSNLDYNAFSSAGVPSVTEQSVELFEGAWMRCTKQSRGLSGSFWTKTYSDGLGRPTAVVHSAPPGQPNPISRVYYGRRGQPIRQVDADGFSSLSFSGEGAQDATLFGLNPPVGVDFSGEWNLTVQDLDSDGVVDWSGPDRISLSRTFMSTRDLGGGIMLPVHRSLSVEWTTDGNATAIEVLSESDASLDGKRTWTTSRGRTSATTVVESGPNVTTTTVDDTGAISVSVTKYGRQVSTQAQNALGEITSRTETTYDVAGRVAAVRHMRGATHSAEDLIVTMTYGVGDRLVARSDPQGSAGQIAAVTTFGYDHLGRRTTVVSPGSKTTTTTYWPTGAVRSVRGFGANPVDYAYDDLGRMVSITTYKDPAIIASAATTTWVFDPHRGNMTEKWYQGASQPASQYTYSAAGRLLTRTNARNTIAIYQYGSITNPSGGLLSAIDYSDGTADVRYAYDRRGRLVNVVDAAGSRTITYSPDGRPNSELYRDDPMTISENLLSGLGTMSAYGAYQGLAELGNRTEVKLVSFDPAAAVPVFSTIERTTFKHDAYGRTSNVRRVPSVSSWNDWVEAAFTYDLFTGQVSATAYRVRNGGTTSSPTYRDHIVGTRAFDLLGRLESFRWTDVPPPAPAQVLAETRFSYDEYGRRIVSDISTWKERWEYAYDERHQLTQATAAFNEFSPPILMPGHQFTYGYDQVGNRTTLTQGDDLDGFYSSTYTSNLLNQLTQRDVPGFVHVSGRSPAPAVLVATSGGTPSQPTQSYRLDPFTAGGGFYHLRASFDNTQVARRETVNVFETPGPFTAFQVYVPKTPEVLTYDADGNLASDSMWDYAWDAENRLVSMDMKPSATVLLGGDAYRLLFAYDHMGRRIQKKSQTAYVGQAQSTLPNTLLSWKTSSDQRYLYQGPTDWRLGATLLMSDGELMPQQTYIWGPDISGTETGAGGIGGLVAIIDQDSPTPRFPLYDGNGNLTHLYSAELVGNVPQRSAEYRYGPFGESRGMTGDYASRNPFRFSSKFTDNETGLSYYGHRYYSASMGRWISRDPIEEQDGPNVYGFVGNRPVDAVDALGLYGKDYHFYAVYYMARAKCFNQNDAFHLAKYSQDVDDRWYSNPLHLGAGALLQYYFAWAGPGFWFAYYMQQGPVFDLRDYHFWGSSPTTATRRNAAELGYRFRTALQRDRYEVAGRWLHTFADTWAHEGFSAWPNRAINSRGGGPLPWRWSYVGHVDTPEDGHFPDNPYNDVPKAMESASRIMQLMDGLRPARECDCTSRFMIAGGLNAMFSHRYPDELDRVAYNKHIIQLIFREWVDHEQYLDIEDSP